MTQEMGRPMRLAVGIAALALAAAGPVSADAAEPVTAASVVTFSRDVAPIVFKNCAACHRTGEVGPMPLTSFLEVRPWARAIRLAVESRTMPPWLADPAYGDFSNDPRLSSRDVETITRWIDAGAPEGSRADLPALPPLPDPAARVPFGPEIMNGYFEYTLDGQDLRRSPARSGAARP
jgi:mono/diheme cytochrome c family protein